MPGIWVIGPRYANILNQVIASAKHGGVLKFQQGGIQEGKQLSLIHIYQRLTPITSSSTSVTT